MRLRPDTKVSSIPTSDRPTSVRLVSCSRLLQGGKAGEGLFIPAVGIHVPTNVGAGKGDAERTSSKREALLTNAGEVSTVCQRRTARRRRSAGQFSPVKTMHAVVARATRVQRVHLRCGGSQPSLHHRGSSRAREQPRRRHTSRTSGAWAPSAGPCRAASLFLEAALSVSRHRG